MGINVHWIDSGWGLRQRVLDFRLFQTPHTGEAASTLLWEVMEDNGILSKVRSIKTDNESDIVSGARLLSEDIVMNLDNSAQYSHQRVHCASHVINLAIEEFLSLVQDLISSIISLLVCIRSSVKRRDIFQKLKI